MLRKLLLAAVMLLAPPVAAQDTFKPGLPITDTNPAPRKNMCWSGTAYVICPTAGTTPRPSGASADQVQGTSATGAAPVGNPDSIAGIDINGATRPIRTTVAGAPLLGSNGTLADGINLSVASGIDVAGTYRPLGAASMVFNGSGFFYSRDGNSASGTSGTGLLGVANLGWDGLAYRRFRTLVDGSQVVAEIDGGAVTVTPLTAAGVLFSVQTTGYAGVSYITNTGWSGSTIQFEGSNDSTTGTDGLWVTIGAQIIANATPGGSTQSAGAAFFLPAVTTWVRARVSAYTSGTIGGSAALRSLAPFSTNNTINNNKALWFTESNGTVSVATGTNLNGLSRDTGVAGSDYRYANWSCFANPTVSSTGALLVAQGSLDNSNWVTTQVVAAATAGQASTTQNGIFFRYNRCMFNNTGGGAATNVYLNGRYSE